MSSPAKKTVIIKRPTLNRPAIIVLSVLGLILVAFAGCQLMRGKGKAEPYRTEQVMRGDLTRSVSASGTLEALVTVEVGSQISGQIRDVYVDFNDRVNRGQVMAVLDPQTYVSKAQQGQAQVGADVAGRNQAQAQANVALATYNRQLALYKGGWIAKAALDTAEANWKAAQAQVASASAKINQSQAALASNRVDLSRTNIVAPISGIVVDRQIEPGQTVAASLQAPVLFRIAQDLSRMQVKINVDEADIGQVHEGQTVHFTVDAFPDENFTAVVTQVRKQPSTEQNVVAYTVIAEAENPGLKLLPGMTANADIVIEQKKNVMKVPNAALRWMPADQRPTTTTRGFGPGFGGPGFGPPPGANQQRNGARRNGNWRTRKIGGLPPGTVWVLRDDKPERVRVGVGGTDGTYTEVAGRLQVGDKVITGGGPKPKVKATTPFGPSSSGGGGQNRARMP